MAQVCFQGRGGRESEDTWELQSALQHPGADFVRKAWFLVDSWIAPALAEGVTIERVVTQLMGTCECIPKWEAKSQTNMRRIWGRKPHGSGQSCVEYDLIQNREIQQLCRKRNRSYSRSQTKHESTVPRCCEKSKHPAELCKQKNSFPGPQNNPSTLLRVVSEPTSRAAVMYHLRWQILTALLENLQDHRFCLDTITFTERQVSSSNYVLNACSLPTDNISFSF